MHVYPTTIRIIFLISAAVFLGGCNPATIGWSSSKGSNVSSARLIAAKHTCGYQRARQRAVRLLDASGNRYKNERRAARLLGNAERCMKKYGMYYRSRRPHGIGSLRSR